MKTTLALAAAGNNNAAGNDWHRLGVLQLMSRLHLKRKCDGTGTCRSCRSLSMLFCRFSSGFISATSCGWRESATKINLARRSDIGLLFTLPNNVIVAKDDLIQKRTVLTGFLDNCSYGENFYADAAFAQALPAESISI